MSTKRKKASKSAPKKAPAPAKKAASQPKKTAGGRGIRYDASKKKEVVDFANEYNQKNGRGGQSAAARKFGITILTVSSWLKSSGQKPAAKTPKGLAQKVGALLGLSDEISKAEAQLAKLKEKYAALSSSIRSEL